MKASDNLVYGHTHRPYCIQGSGGNWIANTGCWCGRNAGDAGPVNTFVMIDEGKMSLHSFTGGKIF
jgi:predicted phosphodiesterase